MSTTTARRSSAAPLPQVAAERRILVGVLAAAAVVRGIYLWQMSACPAFYEPIIDARTYHDLARGLAVDGTVTEVFLWQPIFYPLFLAGVYSMVGPAILAAKIVQLLLGCLTCVGTYRIARQVFGRTAGLVAAGLVITNGPLMFFELELLATGWAAFWSVVLMGLLMAGARGPGSSRGALGGILPGILLGIAGALAILTRTVFLPFLAVGCVWLIWRLGREGVPARARCGVAAGIAGGLLIVLLPVALFCQARTGHAGLLPPSGGINLFIGNNPDFDRTVTVRPGWQWTQLRSLPVRDGGGADMWSGQEYFLGRVARYATSRPLQFLHGLGQKMLHLIGSREIPRTLDVYFFRQWSAVLSVTTWRWHDWGFPFGVLLPLAVLGLISRWRQVPVPLRLFVLLYAGSIVVVFVAARYRVVLVPALAILAAGGLDWIGTSWRRRRWRALAVAGCGMALLVILGSVPGPFAQEKLDFAPEFHHNLGYNHYRAGHWAAAEASFGRALALKPDMMEAHHFWGLVLAQQGRFAEAAGEFAEAARLDPSFGEARHNLELARRKAAEQAD